MHDSSVDAYPLTWPAARPRTQAARRTRAPFFGRARGSSPSGYSYAYRRDKTVNEALRSLEAELDRLGARRVIISTNLKLRLDGGPRSNQKEPDDPGVAVYFDLKGKNLAMAVDRWDRVADNLYAIAKCIEAIRGLDRWGAKDMVEAAFTGFKALPASAGGTPWWEYLGVEQSATEEEIREAYRESAKGDHPDVPTGSHERFQKLRDAYEQGLATVRGSR